MSGHAEPIARTPRRRRRLRRVGVNALGVLVFAVMTFPVYWMVNTAFKPGIDIQSYTPKFFPHPATLRNFSDAINRAYFWDVVKNSLVVVGVVTLLSLVLAFLAALALAKFRFYGRRAFIVLVILVQMVPITALIIPLYVLLSRAHQVDKLSGVIVTYLTFVLPFCIWTLRGFMRTGTDDRDRAPRTDPSPSGAMGRVPPAGIEPAHAV